MEISDVGLGSRRQSGVVSVKTISTGTGGRWWMERFAHGAVRQAAGHDCPFAEVKGRQEQ